MDELKIFGTAEALNQKKTYTTSLRSQGHSLIADEPVAVGGHDEGPSPTDYICMSLAACKAITLRMYVERKQWDVGEINVKVKLAKADGAGVINNIFFCEILVSGNLTTEQKERLVQIAKACPISKLLSKASDVVTQIA